MRRISFRQALGGLLALGVLSVLAPAAHAQNISAGVHVDADGVLKSNVVDATGQLLQQRKAAATASLNAEVRQATEMRKVSLNRLEKAIEESIAAGRPLNDEMLHLAGLTRVQYVFYYPDTQDIVLAGPAEGWFDAPHGRPLGLESGKPVLELQDLVTALRAFAPGKKDRPVIGCSIDPTAQGLANMQKFLASVGRNLSSPSATQYIVKGLQSSLGLQEITIHGVPGES